MNGMTDIKGRFSFNPRLRQLGTALAVFAALQVIVFACCPPARTYYDRLRTIHVANANLKDPVPDSAFVWQRDFRIHLDLEGEAYEVVDAQIGFGTQAYAIQCEEDFRGLDTAITGFALTCSADLLGITAGDPIPYEHLSAYRNGFVNDHQNTRLTIEDWLEELNSFNYGGYSYNLEFNDPIPTHGFVQFTITLEQEGGRIYQKQTDHVWVY